MTNTLIQNSKIDEIIDITKYQFSSQGETDGSFSALFTNATNKVEQTQSNFIDTAVKSNTSSINKYALDGQNQKIKNNQVQSKKQNNNSNSSNINSKKQFTTKDINAKSKNIQNNQNTKSKNNQTALSSINNKTVSRSAEKPNTVSSQTPVSMSQKASVNADSNPQNTNNSSLEPSPISLDNSVSNETQNIELKGEISNNETMSAEDTQKEIKDLVENILITFDIPINTNDDNSIDTESLFNNSDSTSTNYDFVIQAIDEISSQIDDMDLAKDDKDAILEAFDKLKVAVQNINNNYETDKINNEIADYAKKLLDSLNSATISDNKQIDTKNITEAIDNNKVQINKEEINPKQNILDSKNFEELKKVIDEIASNKDMLENKDAIQELSAKLDEIISETEQSLNNTENLSDNNDELIQALKNLNENIKNNNIKEINKNLKEIPGLIKDSKIAKTEQDTTKDVSIPDNSELKADNKLNLEDLKIEDNDKISEIVSKLKEFQKSSEYSKLSDEDKKEIQETIDKLIKAETRKPTVENEKIVEDVKKEIDKIINTDTQKTDSDVKISLDEQIGVKQNESVKADNYNSNQNSNERNDNYQKETVKISAQPKADKIDYKNNETDIDVETSDIDETDIEINNGDDIEINQKADSQNKISLIDEIKEDFFESIEYTKEAPVVISVADEVVKFALSENNSLSNEMVPTNITYDPANSAIKIRNVQNLVQNNQIDEANTKENDILNQISNKLYQLKDSQKLNLVLRPNDLGRLSIELTSDKNGLTTNIIAQNETVRSYIEKNISALKTQLTEAGINVNTIQIKTAGQDGASTYDGNQNKEFTQEENAQKQNQQQFQQKHNQRQNENLAHLRNYDMHFAKDFSSVLDKTLSYIN